jgi:hypothetical protein
MAALPEKQRAFVIAMVTQPGLAANQWALIAGYSDSSEAAKVTACRLLQQESINAAIHECAWMRMRSAALVAADTLVRIAANPQARDGDRLRAAEALLDRVGLAPIQKIDVEHKHTDHTGAALMERIRELAGRHGLDPERLLAGHKPEEARAAQPVINGVVAPVVAVMPSVPYGPGSPERKAKAQAAKARRAAARQAADE